MESSIVAGFAPWGIAIVVIAASCIVLRLNASPSSSNAHLSISIGGGLGLVMLMNAWGVVVQKKMMAWMRAASEQGAPMPPESQRLLRSSFLASRTAFWISFPMLFFMSTAERCSFLSGLIL